MKASGASIGVGLSQRSAVHTCVLVLEPTADALAQIPRVAYYLPIMMYIGSWGSHVVLHCAWRIWTRHVCFHNLSLGNQQRECSCNVKRELPIEIIPLPSTFSKKLFKCSCSFWGVVPQLCFDFSREILGLMLPMKCFAKGSWDCHQCPALNLRLLHCGYDYSVLLGPTNHLPAAEHCAQGTQKLRIHS